MSGLADRIRYALANPLRDDHAIDPMRELAELLREVGLEPESDGGAVTCAGRDPIETSFLAGRDVARPAHLGGQLDRHHLAGDEPIKQVAIAARRVPAAPTGMGKGSLVISCACRVEPLVAGPPRPQD